MSKSLTLKIFSKQYLNLSRFVFTERTSRTDTLIRRNLKFQTEWLNSTKSINSKWKLIKDYVWWLVSDKRNWMKFEKEIDRNHKIWSLKWNYLLKIERANIK